MKRCLRKKFSLSTLLLAATLLPGWALAETTFSRMCIFGDSLSDTGNVFEVEHQVSTRPYELIPSYPYPVGGPTFSNGRAWIQHLAESLERENDAKPAFRGSGPFCNYSFGAARARQRVDKPFDFPGLIDQYFEDFDSADPETLYIVFVGGNDIRDALEAWLDNPNNSFLILQDALTSIMQGISDLAAAGARRFLVVNAANVSIVPAITARGPNVVQLAWFLSSHFNDALGNGLEFLPPELEIMQFDLFAFTASIVSAPPAGVTNTTESCITPGVTAGAVCADPDQYMFWDGIHPTRVIHAALAEAVTQALVEYGAL